MWGGVRSITANWHLRLTSSLSTSTTLSTLPPSTVYCLTLLLLCQPAPPTNMYCLTLPWRQSAHDRQQCPPYSEPAVAPMVGEVWEVLGRDTTSQCERHYFPMWETLLPNVRDTSSQSAKSHSLLCRKVTMKRTEANLQLYHIHCSKNTFQICPVPCAYLHFCKFLYKITCLQIVLPWQCCKLLYQKCFLQTFLPNLFCKLIDIYQTTYKLHIVLSDLNCYHHLQIVSL